MQYSTGAPAVTVRAPEEGSERLRIHVLFTSPQETKAALRYAEKLSADLNAEIALILTPIVPFPLPLEQPPAPVDFTQGQIREMTDSVDRDVVSYIYLCRDPLHTLSRALRPHSLLVIGIGRRWIFSKSERFARALRRRGHEVIAARV